MKLYRAYNGYTGFSAVHVIVVAESETQAAELAANSFKVEGERKCDERYWQNIEVELLCDDLTCPFVTEPID